MWLFLTVPWVGLQYVIVVFPDYIRLLLEVVVLFVVVDLLFYVPPIVCEGSVLVFTLVCITLCDSCYFFLVFVMLSCSCLLMPCVHLLGKG